MRRMRLLLSVAGLVAVLMVVPACQRMVEVKTGTRIVDAKGTVVSESIRTVRVPMDQAAKYRVLTVAEEAKLASLYAEAQDAITAGDLGTAEKRLAAVLAITDSYRQAKAQYDAIKSGKKVVSEKGGDGSKPSPKPPAPKPPPAQPDIGLLKWVPEKLTGFTSAKALVDPLTVSRQYTAAAGQDVATLIIAAEQFRTSKNAKRALTYDVKSRYTKDAGTMSINGHEVYFGTDGKQFAVVGFVDGAVMVAVEGSVGGAPPASLKGLLKGIVEQLP